MPRLREYRTRPGHFYLNGVVPGRGFCTWQISAGGLDWLRRRHGVVADGLWVSVDELQDLRDYKRVTTGGGGPGAVDPAAAGLASRLEAWAARGGPADELTPADIDRCLSDDLLGWFEGLDSEVPLSGLDALTAAQFEEAARWGELPGLHDPLHAALAFRGAVGVYWRLGRLVGVAAGQALGGGMCPPEWAGRPSLARAFEKLKQRPQSTAPKGRLRLQISPWVEWRIDRREVVAVYPGQALPDGADAVTWQVTGDDPVPAAVSRRECGDRESAILPPLTEYAITAKFQAGCPRAAERWVVELPAESSPVVLFYPSGQLIPVGGDALPAGEYLALVRPGAGSPKDTGTGVAWEEPEDAPDRWRGWRGWRVGLTAGAVLGTYAVAADAAAWEAEPPTDAAVEWAEPWPVYVGRLPRVFVTDAGNLSGAVVAVGRADAPPLFLRAGTDIPLAAESGRTVLDLPATTALRECYGRVRVACRPPARCDSPPLTLDFVRLPDVGVSYEGNGAAFDVRVVWNEPRRDLTPGPVTLVLPDAAGCVLRATDPAAAPVVVGHAADRGTIRVRVPVTRGGVTSAEGEFRAWHPLPLPPIDLREVGPGEKLRLEFRDPPPTTGSGELVFRTPDGADAYLGKEEGPRTFAVPLVRLRDAFRGSAGPVQVRGEGVWTDVFPLPGTQSEIVPPANPTLAQLDADIATARSRDVSPGKGEARAIAAARAVLVMPEARDRRAAVEELLAPLANRPDLPEAAALATLLALHRDPPGAPTRQAGVPTCPESLLVRAEEEYHFARTRRGGVPAAWRSCQELCEQVARTAPQFCLARSDAVLLWAVAQVMQPEKPPRTLPAVELLPGHAAWARAVAFLGRAIWSRTDAGLPPGPLPPAPPVLRPEDVRLVQLAVADAAGSADADALLATFAGWGPGEFFAIGLFRARAAVRAGRGREAGEEYDRLMAGPLFAPVLLERPHG